MDDLLHSLVTPGQGHQTRMRPDGEALPAQGFAFGEAFDAVIAAEAASLPSPEGSDASARHLVSDLPPTSPTRDVGTEIAAPVDNALDGPTPTAQIPAPVGQPESVFVQGLGEKVLLQKNVNFRETADLTPLTSPSVTTTVDVAVVADTTASSAPETHLPPGALLQGASSLGGASGTVEPGLTSATQRATVEPSKPPVSPVAPRIAAADEPLTLPPSHPRTPAPSPLTLPPSHPRMPAPSPLTSPTAQVGSGDLSLVSIPTSGPTPTGAASADDFTQGIAPIAARAGSHVLPQVSPLPSRDTPQTLPLTLPPADRSVADILPQTSPVAPRRLPEAIPPTSPVASLGSGFAKVQPDAPVPNGMQPSVARLVGEGAAVVPSRGAPVTPEGRVTPETALAPHLPSSANGQPEGGQTTSSGSVQEPRLPSVGASSSPASASPQMSQAQPTPVPNAQPQAATQLLQAPTPADDRAHGPLRDAPMTRTGAWTIAPSPQLTATAVPFAATPLPSANPALEGQSVSQGALDILGDLDFTLHGTTSAVTTTSLAPAVTVLGQAPSAMAQTVAQQIAVALSHSTKGPDAPLELALDPPELGRVRMQFSEVSGVMTLMIQAERPETAELMRRHMDLLAQEFAQAGLDAPSVHVSQDGAEGGGGQPSAGHTSDPDAAQGHDTDAPTTHVTLVQAVSGGLDLRL